MTIDKAIKVLVVENRYPWNRENSDLLEAGKLGIEALKQVRDGRDHRIPGWNTLLPGETSE